MLSALALSLLLNAPVAQQGPSPHALPSAGAPTAPPEDPRTWQHGIDFVRVPNADPWLIWSSAGNPPILRLDSDAWTHDVFAARIDPLAPSIQPRALISHPEAQEPASSAVSADGHILVTMEDGWNVQNATGQRFGVYDRDLNPIAPYPRLVLDGGHSGHAAAVGNTFVVFYSEGWVSGGGVNNLGSGDDVWVDTFDSVGHRLGRRGVAVGSTTRDWWPLVAGSADRALLVWQRFVPGETYVNLMVAVFDPATATLLAGPRKLKGFTRYYTYDVQYLEGLDAFLVLASWQDEADGFATLLDRDGNVLAENLSIPRPVREGQPAWTGTTGGVLAVYPTVPNRLTKLLVSPVSIQVAGEIVSPIRWSEIGTDGVFLDSRTVFFAGLSTHGIRSVRVRL